MVLHKALLKLQYGWDWPEFLKDSWSLEETGCHSDFRERPLAKTTVKILQGVK